MEKKELLMGLLVIAFCGGLGLSLLQQKAAGNISTFQATKEGASCGPQWPNKYVTECEYRVGRALRFSIVGVGGTSPRVRFLKADSGSDYFASYSTGDGCVVVERGEQGKTLLSFDKAFVSPRDGRVYRSRLECQATNRKNVKFAGLWSAGK